MVWDASYMTQRAILTPKNDDVQKLNDILTNQFPGEEHNLLSFDEVERDTHALYQHEFLNSITQGSLPPHIFILKKVYHLCYCGTLTLDMACVTKHGYYIVVCL
jgi:ATP-dependent DNA helicase PIF1